MLEVFNKYTMDIMDAFEWFSTHQRWVWLACTVIVSILTFNQYPNITELDETSIYGSIVQGMSAILSVSIAVIIFRIQSLENRNINLEETTLNYVYQMIRWTNPRWDEAFENQIINDRIKKRYYRKLVEEVHRNRYENIQEYYENIEDIKDRSNKEAEHQNERLKNNLKIHQNTIKLIQYIKKGYLKSTILMILPVFIGLLMLLISNGLNTFTNYIMIYISVLFSIIGIITLLFVVYESIKQSNV